MSEKLANPAPLGLLGFGLTTVLLNLANANLFPLNSMVLAMGLAYGGLAQIIAGAMEFKRGNTFGMVAFSSYGFFWWSLVALVLLPNVFSSAAKTNPTGMAAYFFMWGLFTFVMFFGTLKSSRALQFVFGSLWILFFLLTATQLLHAGAGSAFLDVTGYEGVVCGLSAVYLGLAEVVNEAYRKILPIGQIKQD